MMNFLSKQKIKTQVSLVICTVLSLMAGCNDGSGFVSTQSESQENVSEQDVSAIRNVVADTGSSIEAIEADSPAAEGVVNLIDGKVDTKFLTFSRKAEVIFTAAKPITLTGYQLSSANDAPERDPLLWTLEGSNDNETWTLIDGQDGQSFPERLMTRDFDLSMNQTEYKYYRFVFDNTSGEIFQLAELALLVQSDIPIPDFTVSTVTPQIGEYVIFNDTSLVSPTEWEWTFEGGVPASSSEQNPLVYYHELGAKTVTLVAKNSKGESIIEKEHFIRVWDKSEPWAGFPSPVVEFTQTTPEHPSQVILERVLPDLEQQIQEISLEIAKKLYNNVTEINIFESVNFTTGLYEFPAAKAGTDKNMILLFDLAHIESVAQEGDQAVREEVIGVLWHELTHGYNNVPDSGSYVVGNELHSYLEGLANFIRIDAGYIELSPKWIESWNDDAYNQTSLFLKWVSDTNRSTDFIRQFNASAARIESWSFDKAFKSIFGQARGINEVFAEYQQYLKTLGLAPFPDTVEGYTNIAIAEGVTVTTNATHIGLWGEGPDKINDNNIFNKFNGVIEAPWWLNDYLPELMPINNVDAVEVVFELTDAQQIDKYSVVSGNDNEVRDPTSWEVFGANDAQQWVLLSQDFFPETPQRLTTYQYDIKENIAPYRYYKFVFRNDRTEGTGGDNGRLVQLAEIALLQK